ncbi:hypothetical protein ACWCQK_34885 [Streptomyces sp. NPDC002306]
MEALRGAGAQEQAQALATRAANHAPLHYPGAVAELLGALQAGQSAALPARCPALHVHLNRPHRVLTLLTALREAGADEQATALARRTVADVPLDQAAGTYGWAELLQALREVVPPGQIAALLARLPAVGRFDLFLEAGAGPEQFRFGREPDGTAAPPWTWDDLEQ